AACLDALHCPPAARGAPTGRKLFILGALAIERVLAVDIPLARFGVRLVQSGVPFTDRATAAAAIVALGLLGIYAVVPAARARAAVVAALFALAVYLVPFELAATPAVVAWSALAVAALLTASATTYAAGRDLLRMVGLASLLLAGGALLAVLAPPSRLWVHATQPPAGAPIWSIAIAALALVAALAVAAWIADARRLARGCGVAAGGIAVYLLSVATVDLFQRQVGPGADVVGLMRQAQVALSVLWAVLGGVTLGAGLARFGAPVRLFGLALLALATAKVFLYDLASLDAAYRVLSFIALGALLLASSYAYRRTLAVDPGRVAGEEAAPSGSAGPKQ
ncbi:MAG TPA: DUF2339 domain-containing protein, partial [Thermomicrobiales bacterium]|nr:DUF2339 domain-containing protein [Thermomicrobiales bacterium]